MEFLVLIDIYIYWVYFRELGTPKSEKKMSKSIEIYIVLEFLKLSLFKKIGEQFGERKKSKVY